VCVCVYVRALNVLLKLIRAVRKFMFAVVRERLIRWCWCVCVCVCVYVRVGVVGTLRLVVISGVDGTVSGKNVLNDGTNGVANASNDLEERCMCVVSAVCVCVCVWCS